MSDSHLERATKPRTIEEQAAEWFGRCEIGLSAEQERQFLQWLESDARHGEAMRELDETWEFLDGLKKIDRPRVDAIAKATTTPVTWLADRRSWLWAAAAALALGGLTLWSPWNDSSFVHHAATESGQMRRMDLPDGSIVHLNANSDVRVRLTEAARQVQLLRGEAHFAVAKDSRRPFVVTAREVAVNAVGTAFNIRLEAESVEVLVTEGRVSLTDVARGESLLTAAAAVDPTLPASPAPASEGSRVDSASPPRPAATGLLEAGQRALVPLAGAAKLVSPVVVVAPIAAEEIQRALAWQTARQLEFDMTPLSEVVVEFNRYNHHQLVIVDAELAGQPFGGSFRADNYHVFVELLEQRFQVVAERQGDRTLLRLAR